MCQSSNDVIPTAINIAVLISIEEELLPSIDSLIKSLSSKSSELKNTVKTGRTHLMDAMPITMGQEIDGWKQQMKNAYNRIEGGIERLSQLAQGGTAVGTGVNAHQDFGRIFVRTLSKKTGNHFMLSASYFESLSSQDTSLEISSYLKSLAVSLLKISNDLRWMNSGPLSGIGEIKLPELQPGSSIMPGKVNPVIPEAVAMAAAQVIGNDTTITIAAQSGNFQLNVMLPIIAHNLLESIHILINSIIALNEKAISGFEVNYDKIKANLDRNPILVTALNSIIGYELGAKIAKTAYREKRSVRDVAIELTDLSEAELERILDPSSLTEGGLKK
jgi:fumarate hydratase class II